MNTNSVIFSVDAETVGLYGDHFAIGWSLRDATTGNELSHGYDACPFNSAKGNLNDQIWVTENVLPNLPKETTVKNPKELYEKFWKIWINIKNTYKNLYCVADYAYPVESRLFQKCVELDENRTFDGPYPLHEVATMLLAAQIDRKTIQTNNDEILIHHPTHDARYSGRLFYIALRSLKND